MDPQQIRSVRDSFALLRPAAGPVASLFYDNLFDADPTLRALFRGDLATQGERLMAMIGAAVDLLDRPDVLLPRLRALGARHVNYGVTEAYYATVGDALMTTLAQGLGDAFEPSLRDAWGTVYGTIRTTMLEGATEPALLT